MESPNAVNLPGLRWVKNPTEVAFLRSIANNPDDDAPRLVYADWLNDQGRDTDAARMRWFVNGLRNVLSTRHLERFGSTKWNVLQNPDDPQGPASTTPHGLQQLHQKYGLDALNIYNALYRRLINRLHPIDWQSIKNMGYLPIDSENLRRNIEGVHLANELMSLGALPKSAYLDVEHRGLQNINHINSISPTTHPQFGHALYLHNNAAAGTREALKIANIPSSPENELSSTQQTARLYSRATGNIAATRNAEEGGTNLNPDVYNDAIGQNMNIAAGLANHPHWNSFPTNEQNPSQQHSSTLEESEHFQKRGTLHQFIRQAVKLRLDKTTEPQSPPTESFTYPEKRWLESPGRGTGIKPREEYTTHIEQIHDPSAKPFEHTVPHVRTLTALAEIGTPVQGIYEQTAKDVKTLFGHDPEAVTAWMGLNGAFSPQTSYNDHTGAASMLTAAWLNARKPKDEVSIRRLIEAVDAFGKHFTPELAKGEWELNPKTGKYINISPGAGETFGGTMRAERNILGAIRVLQNTDKLQDALEDPTGQAGQHLELLGGGGTSKVPNFVLSYLQPYFGTALDTHMARIMMNPDLDSFKYHSNILRQIRAHMPPSSQEEMSELERKSLRGVPLKSELVKALMKHPGIKVQTSTGTKEKTVSDWLKTLNLKLLEKPQHYLAYKYAVNEAAKKLNWKPAQIQEAVWTSLVGLMAANQLGIPHKEIQQHLTADALRMGWNNHESIYFPKLVELIRRGGASQSTLRKLGQRLQQRAATASRPGIIRIGHAADIPTTAAHLPGISIGRHAGRPIYQALKRRLQEHGLLNPKTGLYQAARSGFPLQLMAQYDRPIDFGPALDRTLASNQDSLIQGLKQVLQQSGITPHQVTPAIHDYAGLTRSSVVALGKFANPQAPQTGTAWMGLLGRQPGMLSFRGNANGKDSIYTFHHHDAGIVRNVLQNAGIVNRTIVPHQTHYQVYVYDPENKLRQKMAQALTQLKATATEWRGEGKTLGGETEDMGRAQYRTAINQGET